MILCRMGGLEQATRSCPPCYIRETLACRLQTRCVCALVGSMFNCSFSLADCARARARVCVRACVCVCACACVRVFTFLPLWALVSQIFASSTVDFGTTAASTNRRPFTSTMASRHSVGQRRRSSPGLGSTAPRRHPIASTADLYVLRRAIFCGCGVGMSGRALLAARCLLLAKRYAVVSDRRVARSLRLLCVRVGCVWFRTLPKLPCLSDASIRLCLQQRSPAEHRHGSASVTEATPRSSPAPTSSPQATRCGACACEATQEGSSQ